jgi:hypothetical protein
MKKIELYLTNEDFIFTEALLKRLGYAYFVFEVESSSFSFTPEAKAEEVWGYTLEDYEASRKADWFEGQPDVEDLATITYQVAGKKYSFTPEEVEFAEGLKEAFKEAKAMGEQEKDFQTLDDFLDRI